MALRGLKVIELAGLAPAPFCGMILADFGARVIRIDKTSHHISLDTAARGKRSIAIDLKSSEGVNTVKRLCSDADVLVEPFRRGVMEKLGLGPEVMMQENPRLVYARLTGFGQAGPYSHMAGHDINYLAVSGVLSKLGRAHEKPYAPINLLADFAGGGMLCALGIMMALFERSKSNKGQVIDSNMVEGSAYVASWLWRSSDMPIWGQERGQNVLDGGAPFYDTYKTKDGKYVAVGALEPQFYRALTSGLGLTEDDMLQSDNFGEQRQKFTKIFSSKTQKEWCSIFDGTDACVTPVVAMQEAAHDPHNKSRNSFVADEQGKFQPRPAPVLSRTPGAVTSFNNPRVGQHTKDILLEAGYNEEEIRILTEQGVVELDTTAPKPKL